MVYAYSWRILPSPSFSQTYWLVLSALLRCYVRYRMGLRCMLILCQSPDLPPTHFPPRCPRLALFDAPKQITLARSHPERIATFSQSRTLLDCLEALGVGRRHWQPNSRTYGLARPSRSVQRRRVTPATVRAVQVGAASYAEGVAPPVRISHPWSRSSVPRGLLSMASIHDSFMRSRPTDLSLGMYAVMHSGHYGLWPG
ncbi:hypothetical protein OH77DRAFT_1024805 [Trametes cingulata]|nr:hypothetical protein OH77DRAFT_1024805 [Trametes cingulata]